MNHSEWRRELQTYKTPKEIAEESLVGLSDHINTKCTTGNTNTVATRGRQPRAPFKQEPTVCDRGTRGCNLVHNDGMALEFAEMALQRIVEVA